MAAEIIDIPSARVHAYIREIYTLIRPMAVVGVDLVRKGRDFDGGYVMLNKGLSNTIVYSIGINDDDSWDVDMANLGCQVFQYDHTIESFPSEHQNFHSFKIGLCERQTNDTAMKTLDRLIEENGHKNESSMILKMDVEGAEWGIFEKMPEATIDQFSQIVAELHWFDRIGETNHLRRLFAVLAKLNRSHQAVHIHANNCGGIVFAEGITIPATLEITYARKSDYTFAQCLKTFPTPYDMPNDASRPDYFLGALGLY